MLGKEGYIKWFSEFGQKDVALAGVKGANLAEMYNNRFPVPPGFVISVKACEDFLQKTGIAKQIDEILKGFEVENEQDLNEASAKIQKLIREAKIPKEIEQEILEAYEVLDVGKKVINSSEGGALDILRNSHEPPFVAVRSSATEEDSDNLSFAGQHESFLNVKGSDELLRKVKDCFASLYSPRAIYYKYKRGRNYENIFMAVVVQRMIDSYKSGVLFSKNPLKNDGRMLIEASWGLGSGVVSGKVNPDMYFLDSELEIVGGEIGNKKIAVVRNSSGQMAHVPLTEERSKQQVLTGHELKKLAQIALRLEEHYKRPLDIEFAIDEEGLSILQTRPITSEFLVGEGEIAGNVLISGKSVSGGVNSGAVRFIRKPEDLIRVKHGDVIVAETVTPDMVVAMQRAAGIITNVGGVSTHAAILAREIGVPFVISKSNVLDKLNEGQIVTVDGFTGRVIEGEGIEKKNEINPIVPTRASVRISVDIPDYAERAANSGAKEVGVSRIESIIANSGKHPNWYLKNDKIDELTNFLKDGISKIVLYFDGAWFRLSDIRTDEYRNLEGAEKKTELNPLLGNHGIRFSLRNIELLEGELEALKDVSDRLPQKKIGILLPHVSSLKEIDETKRIIERIGLPSNVRLGVMIETPASVQLIEDICERVNYVNIGTDLLIQHTLGIDKNNSEIKELYDELNPAILNSIQYVARKCKAKGIECVISGEAAKNSEIIRIALLEGVKGFSVSADAAERVSKVIYEIENNLYKNEKSRTGMEFEKNRKLGDVDSAFQLKPEQALGAVVFSLIDKQEPVIMNKASDSPNSSLDGVKSKYDEINEEELILKALDEEGFGEESEYRPSFGSSSKGDIPCLNEAIPVASEHFEEDQTEDLIDLDSKATKEAISSIRGNSREIESGEHRESDEEKVAEGVEDDRELLGHDDVDSMLSGEESLGEDEENISEKDEDEILDIF